VTWCARSSPTSRWSSPSCGSPTAWSPRAAARSSRSSGPSRCCRRRPCSGWPRTPRRSEFFERGKTWDAAPERFRLHAVAVQRAADRLAASAGYAHRDRLARHRAAARRRQARAHARVPGLSEAGPRPARTPEERLHYERASWASDHALVGGVLAAAGTFPRPSRRRSSAITPTTRRAMPRSSASRTCSRTTRRARRSPRPSCCGPPATSASPERAARRPLRPSVSEHDRPRAVEPCPLSVR